MAESFDSSCTRSLFPPFSQSSRLLKKNELLHALGGSKLKYKRLALSPIRYAGGKSLAVGHIIEHLPDVQRVISPFLGGGSVELVMNLKLDIEIIACDVLDPLVKYWQEQIQNPKKLADELAGLSPDKETYKQVKNRLKDYWDKKIALPDVEVAALYFFNHNLSYGPSFLGWASSVYLNSKSYNRMLKRVRDFKTKAKFTVVKKSFEEMFKKYPTDFFYCDPPYMLKQYCETSKMFAGIYPQRNFPMHHNDFDHSLLHKCLSEHKGGFILSYNNCSKSRSLYKNYVITHPVWQYTMGQGETRISLNRKNNTHIKDSHEVLISSIH